MATLVLGVATKAAAGRCLDLGHAGRGCIANGSERLVGTRAVLTTDAGEHHDDHQQNQDDDDDHRYLHPAWHVGG